MEVIDEEGRKERERNKAVIQVRARYWLVQWLVLPPLWFMVRALAELVEWLTLMSPNTRVPGCRVMG